MLTVLCADNGRGQNADLSEKMTQSNTDNAMDLDNAAQPDISGVSIRTMCETPGVSLSTVSRTWNRRQKTHPAIFGKFDCDLVPTAEQVALIPMLAKANGVGVKKAGVKWAAVAYAVPVQQPRQEVAQKAKAAPAKKPTDWNAVIEKSTMLLFPGMVTIASVILTICGLYMFAAWAGGILGAMFGLVLVSAVVVARNRMKGGTSQQALDTVLWMEIGAFFLHCFTFHALLPAVPGSFSLFIELGSAAVCAGFASFLSYRAVIMVRNYNAEVDDESNNGPQS